MSVKHDPVTTGNLLSEMFFYVNLNLRHPYWCHLQNMKKPTNPVTRNIVPQMYGTKYKVSECVMNENCQASKAVRQVCSS